MRSLTRFLGIIAGLMVVLLHTAHSATGMVDVRFTPPAFANSKGMVTLDLQLIALNGTQVREVWVHYRGSGDARFHRTRLVQQGNHYVTRLNLAAFEAPVVEYFFDITLANGQRTTYPDNAPMNHILRVSVPQGETITPDNIIIISPEPNEDIYTDELVITVSFPTLAAHVDKNRIKLFLDKYDLTRSKFFRVFDDFLTFSSKLIPPGRHKLRLELYSRTGKLLAKAEWFFTAHKRLVSTETAESQFNYSGAAYGEFRQESYQDGTDVQQYNRLGFNFDATSGAFSFGTNIYLSNQEKSTSQPINRYAAYGQLNFWNNRYVRLTIGDSYPEYGPLSLQNIFVRGFYGSVFLKFFNIEVARGYIQRGVNSYTELLTDTTLVDTISGAYQRNILALRASFGARQLFQMGFSLIKAGDDTSSITSEAAETPKENLLLGSDIYLASKDQSIQFEAYVNASMTNANILGGSLPFDSVATLFPDNSSKWESYYNRLTSLITVNQYINVIPNLAFQFALRFKRWNNNISIVYQRVEDGFNSFGQPYLQPDYNGFSIYDNIGLYKNQVFLTVGLQTYKDNLRQSKSATTTNTNLYFNLSYFPTGNLPSITFGYNNAGRKNVLLDTLGIPENTRTNSVNLSSSYTLVTGSMRNQLTLTLLNYNQADAINLTGNSLSNTVSLVLQTRYSFPLTTTLEFNLQNTESAQETEYASKVGFNSFGFGAEYEWNRFLRDSDNLTVSFNTQYGKVENLSINENLNQNYNRLFLSGRLSYQMPPYGQLSVSGDVINYTGDLQYKDVIITARYDISF